MAAPQMGYEMLRAAELSRSIRRQRSEDRTRRWAEEARSRGSSSAHNVAAMDVSRMDSLIREAPWLSSPSSSKTPSTTIPGRERHATSGSSLCSTSSPSSRNLSSDDDVPPSSSRRAPRRTRPSVPALTLSLEPSPPTIAAELTPGPSLSRSLSPTPSSDVTTPTTPTPCRTAPSPSPRTGRILSIDDIVRKHSRAISLAVSAAKDKAQQELQNAARTSTEHRRERSVTDSSEAESEDSLSHEIAMVSRYRGRESPPTTPTPVAMSRTATPRCTSPESTSPVGPTRARTGSVGSSLRPTPTRSSTTPSRTDTPSPAPSVRPGTSASTRGTDETDAQAAAAYMRSPALNHIVHLARPAPHRPLRVSFADVGDRAGRPVLVFLGLGCVRYLVGLYDELARALGLRLICIDRWGLGRTDQVPQHARTVADWPRVVEHVMDALGIARFQILAHSAGAPYALATAVRMGPRVHGRLHLLAPWVNAEVDGGYKWLKWVPNGVIKSAMAAEWRLESYLLGKAPAAALAASATTTAAPVSISAPQQPPMPPSVEPPLSRTSTDTAQTTGSHASHTSCPLSRASVASLTLQRSATPGRPSSAGAAVMAVEPGRSQSDPLVPRRPTRTLIQADDMAFFADGFDTFTIGLEHAALAAPHALPPAPAPTLSPATPSAPEPAPEERIAPSYAALLAAATRASHAECLQGTTADLLSVVLGRDAKPWGVSYADLAARAGPGGGDGGGSSGGAPAKIWYGSADERVALRGMRWVQHAAQAELEVVPGEGHNLMSSMRVMCDVLDCLATDELV
ncbi:hypothetical protein Q5752_001732 [Cryptotrichosporon argae]